VQKIRQKEIYVDIPALCIRVVGTTAEHKKTKEQEMRKHEDK
jgi:hypothetical protein